MFMARNIAFVGFGEAAQAFAGELPARAYDIKANAPTTRDAKRADYCRAGVDGMDSPGDALSGADLVLSLVTADQTLAAARVYAGLLAPQALWLDMNSVAPATKRAAAAEIHAAGAHYVDVAVLAPVHPQRLAVPLLVSGPHAEAGVAALADIGFTNVRVVSGGIGGASAIKMIRSVMVKGLEAMTAEWILAAEAAGIRDEAIATLNASWPGIDWAEKADYDLDRMMLHGVRRAAELEEVVKTLDVLGTGSAVTRGVMERQRAIGELGLTPPSGLSAKLDVLLKQSKDRAA
jgi:3-hydroxyisobutyrate dehydrogenase-like beta-hydroxyacid dehydrogenase